MRRRSKVWAYTRMKPRRKILEHGIGPPDHVEARTLANLGERIVIFAQGDPAGAVFYLERGKIQLTVVSKAGKEATIEIAEAGDFLGAGCLAGQQRRAATATTLSECLVMRLERDTAIQMLKTDPVFAARLVAYALAHRIRIEEQLVDHLFGSSEQRLARTLLLLANFGHDGKPEKVIPKISQEALAERIGATRSKVSYFMNRFRKLGFIHYNGGIEVNQSLLSVVLQD